MNTSGRRIAVVGSGISGLMAAYVLARRDVVTLYEREDRLGGHAHTHDLQLASGVRVCVDSGFIVHNTRTYPTLRRLFDELDVRTQKSDMSMSVRADARSVEYAGGKGWRGLFPTTRHFVSGRHLQMLLEIPSFHRAARRLLARSAHDGVQETLGEFVAREGFSARLIDDFLIPVVAAVWSCEPGSAMHYPARYLFAFLDHHGMLSVSGSPSWLTVTGGSARYVERMAATVHEIRLGAAVTHLTRTGSAVEIVDARGDVNTFDAAVIAVHPHQALALLSDATAEEIEVLGAIRYQVNRAQLHTDDSLLPRAPWARASWNYIAPSSGSGSDGVIITYDLTRLMRLREVTDRRILVTLGGAERVDPRKVLAEMTYEHPLYTMESVAAQGRLADLSSPVLAFAGAYHGWGFHEDGAASGLAAARRLGGCWHDAPASDALVRL